MASFDQSRRIVGRAVAFGAGLLAVCASAAVAIGPLLRSRTASDVPLPSLFAASIDGAFLTYAAISAASAVLFGLIAAALWRMGATGRRSRRSSQAGSATVEFALVLPIALMLSLIMAQSSLLMGGHLCVNYAAYCAARSAIVSVPKHLANEPRNEVLNDAENSRKMLIIKTAAVWAVLPISSSNTAIEPADSTILQNGLNDLQGSYNLSIPAWIDERLGRRLRYAEDYTDVELSRVGLTLPAALGLEGKRLFGEHEDIKVTVSHTFYLAVPYAAAIFGAIDGRRLDIGGGEYGTVMQASCVLTNEGVDDVIKPEYFPQ